MRKLGLVALLAATTIVGIGAVHAEKKEKSTAGGLEIGGHVDVVTGWQHDTANQTNAFSTVSSSDQQGAGLGQLGDFRGATGPKLDTFGFYLDQAELDIAKSFGDNIRIRTDLDFGRFESGSRQAVAVEQAYVTANIPVGNGIEFAIGRFNLPIGLEAVDRIDNVALSFSNIYRFVRPINGTGAKFYYAFSDNVDVQVYAVNNLFDAFTNTFGTATATDNIVPSFGGRVGFTWGSEGKKSTLGLSGAAGREAIAVGGTATGFSIVADLDFTWHPTDRLMVGAEGAYRQDSSKLGSGVGPICGKATGSCKTIAAQGIVDYAFTDSIDGYIRYDFLNDFDGATTRFTTVGSTGGQIHSGSIGGGYQISDNAKMRAEYRLDLVRPDVVGRKNGFSHGFAVDFAYRF